MENNRMQETKIWWAVIFVVTAGMVALIAAHATHDMLGLSRSTIRVDALRGVVVAGGLLLIFSVGRKFGKR